MPRLFGVAEDITYFKKIELRTKMGRRGRILVPVGKHFFVGSTFCFCPAPGVEVVSQAATACATRYRERGLISQFLLLLRCWQQ